MDFGKVVEGFAHNVGFKDAKKGRVIIIAGSAIVIVALVSYGIIKWRRKVNMEKYGIVDASKELDKLGVTNKNLTITDGKAILISQNLLNAMDGIGTDEQAIFDNLKSLQTADDLKLVIQKFGTKVYAGGNLADSWTQRMYGTMKNLNGWFRAELGSGDVKKVKAIYDALGVPF